MNPGSSFVKEVEFFLNFLKKKEFNISILIFEILSFYNAYRKNTTIYRWKSY